MNAYDYQNYLAHYGIPGMKWGVRRSSASLGNKVSKLGVKNKKLRSVIETYNSQALKYDQKSTALKSRNSKYEGRLAKATAKKAKYDLKQQKELSRRNPNDEKVAKYAGLSAKYNTKIMKAQKKIKYNKYAIKSEEFKQQAKEAEAKIKKNEKTMQVFNSTIKAIDNGTIQQGRVFMKYVTD